jgi:hypothetical protein
MDVHNAAMGNTGHGKKPYQRPKCIQMSTTEVALLVRRKTLGHEIQAGGAGPSAAAEVPLLLVEGYPGDLNFIRPSVRAPARELQPFANKRGLGWIEMQFADAERAEPQGSFLLLDLRNRHRGERGFLELIGHSQAPNETAPRVILAASSEQYLDWKGFDPKQCWQLRSCQTPQDLLKALHSFLHLCSMYSNWSAQENAEPERRRDHVFSGRTDRD